jgi:serine/threonine-protein kinase
LQRCKQPSIQSGTQFGSYTLIERIGRGGMGEVWRARHQLLARQAAIKLIRVDARGATSSVGGAKSKG